MSFRVATLMVLTVSVSAAFADQGDARMKLSGTWQSDGAGGGETWIIQEKADSIHFSHSLGGSKVSDFECNTTGRDCNVKESGHSAKVSLWFSGPKLVELETKGSDVMKRRFAVSNADTMDLEMIPVVPPGKAEVLHFKRVSATPAP